jgi:hypothetical protein
MKAGPSDLSIAGFRLFAGLSDLSVICKDGENHALHAFVTHSISSAMSSYASIPLGTVGSVEGNRMTWPKRCPLCPGLSCFNQPPPFLRVLMEFLMW